jgi:nitroreductase
MLIDLATRRKSIRNYDSSREPDMSKILYSIKVALEAPSGANCQPWLFIIINDNDTKHWIRITCEDAERRFHKNVKRDFKKWLEERNITWRKPFLEEAPVLIAVFNDMACPHSTHSTWLSIGYLILALEEQGLSSLTYTPPVNREINKYLNVPNPYRLEAIIPVGYPKGDKIKEMRIQLKDKVFLNRWGENLDNYQFSR